jgi:hypothetical protein
VIRQDQKGGARALDFCEMVSGNEYMVAVFRRNTDLFKNLKLIARFVDFYTPTSTVPSGRRLLLDQSMFS